MLIRNEYWISIDPCAQNSILHNQSQTKRCENMFDRQTGQTDANSREQGAVCGSRVENRCCLFLTCMVPQQDQERKAPLQLFLVTSELQLLTKAFLRISSTCDS